MHQSKNCLADKVTQFKQIKQTDNFLKLRHHTRYFDIIDLGIKNNKKNQMLVNKLCDWCLDNTYKAIYVFDNQPFFQVLALEKLSSYFSVL